jgi:hypothetical protein
MSSSSKSKASQFDEAEADRGITKVEKNLSLQRGTSNKLKGKKRVEDVEKLEKLKNEESKIENELKKLKEKKKKFLDGGS